MISFWIRFLYETERSSNFFFCILLGTEKNLIFLIYFTFQSYLDSDEDMNSEISNASECYENEQADTSMATSQESDFDLNESAGDANNTVSTF